jgi:hypothetical protein
MLKLNIPKNVQLHFGLFSGFRIFSFQFAFYEHNFL